MTRHAPGGRLLLTVVPQGGAAAMVIRLPEGFQATPLALGLLGEAAEAGGGRFAAAEDGAVLTLTLPKG